MIPIALNFRNRLRRVLTPWSMGRIGPAVNAVAIVWCAFIAIVFMLPPNELTLWTMLLLGAGMALYWRASARKTFAGPGAGEPAVDV